MNFNTIKIAQETVDIIKNQGYYNHTFDDSISKAVLYTPTELKKIIIP